MRSKRVAGIEFVPHEYGWYEGYYGDVLITLQYYNRLWNVEWGADMRSGVPGGGYDHIARHTAEEAVEDALYFIDNGEY